MQPKDYSIVKHLEKTLAQISIFALLMSSPFHRQALLKVLDEAYVPTGTSVENLSAMMGNVIGSHRISFDEDELPFEGVMHNIAMHVTVICPGYVIKRVLIDDGSDLNICPLFTLVPMGYDLGKISQSQVNMRAFDGGQRDTIGEIDLHIQIGLAEFKAKFHVMDIHPSYNLLSGRPWIHHTMAVSSTRHQLLKFIWEDHEIVIQGEESDASHPNGCAPVIEDISKGSSFHAVEIVNAAKKDLTPEDPMSSVYKMIATVMLINGFEPGRGLGKSLEGIVEPIMSPKKVPRYGLGYLPTGEDEFDDKPKTSLPRPLPLLYQSFPVREMSNYDGLGDGIGNLLEGCNIVIDDFPKSSEVKKVAPGEA